METFTLVVWLWLVPGERFDSEFRKASTPGLSLEECKAAAKLVLPPQGRADCFLEGRPEPVWSRPRKPTIECAACGAIPGYNPS